MDNDLTATLDPPTLGSFFLAKKVEASAQRPYRRWGTGQNDYPLVMTNTANENGHGNR